MPYPYDAATLAALTRLSTFYNGSAYDAGTNPGGMAAGGHRTNFIPSLQDLALVGDSVADAADAADADATAAAASAALAAASATALSGTSTTSVSIGTGAKAFTTQASKSFEVGTYIDIVSDASPTTHYMLGQVTSYNDVSGALTVNVPTGGSAGSGSRADWTLYGRAGVIGPAGATGATGAQGATPTVQWNFSSTTTDTDPGNGSLRLDSATYSAVNWIYADNLDRNGVDVTTWVDSFDDSTNTLNRGTITLTQVDTPTTFVVLEMTGSPGIVEDGTGYRKIPVFYVTGSGTFGNGSAVALGFSRTGNKGVDGAGAGDVISDIGASTSGRIVVFNSTDGKHVTQSSFTIGTSGAAIGALSTDNTWGGAQTFAAGVDLQQTFALSGDITPAQITSTQSDYAPAGGTTSSVWRLSTDASRSITGFTGGADGRLLLHINVGSFPIIYQHETTSTAGNRISNPGSADIGLAPGNSILWRYDATISRWQPVDNVGLGHDGAASRPYWSFASDPDCGLYRISANRIGLAAGGTLAIDIQSTGVNIPIASGLTVNSLGVIVRVKHQVFTVDGTYTPSAGMVFCMAEAVGAGGSGGSVANPASSYTVAGGGGAGGYSRQFFSAADIGASKAVDIGIAASAPAAGDIDGTAGADTTLGTTLLIAKGGAGGLKGSVRTGGAGGVAGSSTVAGALLASGAPGNGGFIASGSAVIGTRAGEGGSSHFGGGAVASSAGGAASGAYGGGGSGATATSADAAGGKGSDGVMVITEWCTQ